MLVLSRKTSPGNNEIKIGDDIVISVLRVRGGSVRIGITAPNSVRILRPELCISPEDIKEEATNGLPN